MDMSPSGILGEGSSCLCRKGRVVESGQLVAIKIYKAPDCGTKDNLRWACLTKLRRSIEVLKKLQEPLKPPSDTKLWNPALDHVKPGKLFVQLVDYSRDASGEAGFDVDDDQLYIVTELAQQSLGDYMIERKQDSSPPSQETVRSIAAAILLVMSGLHAKGFVHLDMKPENLMIFNGCLKLIDVDGCVQIGTHISLDDDSISFSPCYCAPELASFVLGAKKQLEAVPGLDTWSTGCTICELVTLDPMLQPAWKCWIENYGQPGRAGFMNTLANLQIAPLPSVVGHFDSELEKLMTDCLLVCPEKQRWTCAESLNAPYLMKARRTNKRRPSNPIADLVIEEAVRKMPTWVMAYMGSF